MRAVIATSTHLRLSDPAAVVMRRLAATANSPLTEIAWPVWPSVAPRPLAIGVSRLTGMNSDAISIATQSAIERTAPHAAAGLVSFIDRVAAVMCSLLHLAGAI